MVEQISRRHFLISGATSTTGIISASATTKRQQNKWAYPSASDTLDRLQSDSEAPVDIRGAVYIPARRFNRFQMWQDYDPAVIERDLSYASRLNLNAIRTWLSYEYWLLDREAHEQALEHFLTTANQYGIRVLLGLFDSVGRAPTLDNLLNSDLLTAVQTFSPAGRTMAEEQLWETPREFIRQFMQEYRDDDRLLAIELSNEPGWNHRDVQFMREMAKTLTWYRGEIPLTVGSTSLANNAEYLDWGMDIFQFHYNFARTPAQYQRVLRQANHVQAKYGKPVWLSEWQRIRPGKRFFADVSGNAAAPDYSSIAPLIKDAGIGNFFWSLMLKPAYSLYMRKKGVLNGVFHEDGSVWSRDDAQAIKALSGDSTFKGNERKEYPSWTTSIKKQTVTVPSDEQPEQ